LLVGCASVEKWASPNVLPADAKVLFLGNSYTDQIQNTFRQMAADAGYQDATLQFVWGGGVTLQRLIDNGRAFKWIEKGGWDVVVLQEQSLRPALGGRSEQAFHNSVDQLVEGIRKIGAEPVLYMTWERCDGWKRAGKLVLDSETMQKKLSAAYRKAAERNEIRVAPIGEAWSVVRKKDDALGRELYRGDGSHPSTKGAYLASCVFLHVLFNEPLSDVGVPEGMTDAERLLIRSAVSEALGIRSQTPNSD